MNKHALNGDINDGINKALRNNDADNQDFIKELYDILRGRMIINSKMNDKRTKEGVKFNSDLEKLYEVLNEIKPYFNKKEK